MSELKTLPKKDSQILRAQAVQLILILAGFFGVVLDVVQVEETIAAVFLLVQVGPVVWTSIARLFKANPPLTETAVKAEEQFQAAPQQ